MLESISKQENCNRIVERRSIRTFRQMPWNVHVILHEIQLNAVPYQASLRALHWNQCENDTAFTEISYKNEGTQSKEEMPLLQ